MESDNHYSTTIIRKEIGNLVSLFRPTAEYNAPQQATATIKIAKIVRTVGLVSMVSTWTYRAVCGLEILPLGLVLQAETMMDNLDSLIISLQSATCWRKRRRG